MWGWPADVPTVASSCDALPHNHCYPSTKLCVSALINRHSCQQVGLLQHQLQASTRSAQRIANPKCRTNATYIGHSHTPTLWPWMCTPCSMQVTACYSQMKRKTVVAARLVNSSLHGDTTVTPTVTVAVPFECAGANLAHNTTGGSLPAHAKPQWVTHSTLSTYQQRNTVSNPLWLWRTGCYNW